VAFYSKVVGHFMKLCDLYLSNLRTAPWVTYNTGLFAPNFGLFELLFLTETGRRKCRRTDKCMGNNPPCGLFQGTDGAQKNNFCRPTNGYDVTFWLAADCAEVRLKLCYLFIAPRTVYFQFQSLSMVEIKIFLSLRAFMQ